MRVYVWDRIVRLLHILLIVGVISAFASQQLGMMEWHAINGYALLVVIAVRIVWGFIGTQNARFSSFIRHPRVVLNYIRTWRTQTIGTTHNPLGGYAVLGLLGMMLAQAISGLFASDDILFYGPLYDTVSEAIAEKLSAFHEFSFYYFLLPMIAVHIAAVIVYLRIKKIDLITPMITGYKKAD